MAGLVLIVHHKRIMSFLMICRPPEKIIILLITLLHSRIHVDGLCRKVQACSKKNFQKPPYNKTDHLYSKRKENQHLNWNDATTFVCGGPVEKTFLVFREFTTLLKKAIAKWCFVQCIT